MRCRLSLLALILFSCAAPRPPVPTITPWTSITDATVAVGEEQKLWEQAAKVHEDLERNDRIVRDEAASRYLDGVLAALFPHAMPAGGPSLRVLIVRSALVNAFAMSDGTILITTSSLAAIANEAQLAVLLGHEIGHLVARHALAQERFEALSQSTVERMELSRAQELEADAFALDAISGAGYDRQQMLLALKLVDDSGSDAFAPFRSHPFATERIARCKTLIDAAPARETRIAADPYDQAVADALAEATRVELKAGLLDRANTTLARHLALRPQSSRGYLLKAELARGSSPEGARSREARANYERAVELAPESAEAVRALGLAYYETGEHQRARPLLEKYLALDPQAFDRRMIERYLGQLP